VQNTPVNTSRGELLGAEHLKTIDNILVAGGWLEFWESNSTITHRGTTLISISPFGKGRSLLAGASASLQLFVNIFYKFPK